MKVNESMIKFHIVTPSFNQCGYLKRCIASVADQATEGIELGIGERKPLTDKHQPSAGLSIHHHIQDGASTDGSREFLAEYLANSYQFTANSYAFSYESAHDNGMYDAINKGMENSLWPEDGSLKTKHFGRKTETYKRQTENDSIVAWLNCDEQYLPGTLEFVGEYFNRHPDVDMLFGDYLIVDNGGGLLSFRKGCAPRLWYIQASHLNNLSCAMFFRAGVFQSVGGFDTQYKVVADEDFVVRALKAGFTAKHVRRYFSIFTCTGSNLGGGAEGQTEFAALKMQTPLLPRLLKIPLNLSRWFEKLLGGTYFQKFPLRYSIFTHDSDARTECVSRRAGWRWPTAE